ncbi:unnamed protein product [Brugia pahangi]|uniref:Uncharacterized protein n=1 Tax=Brugia pahangi TaxID=6280 RepID=A0A0N4TJB2_BRUPA|nr:unnamed protein product [Brugia pahangi]
MDNNFASCTKHFELYFNFIINIDFIACETFQEYYGRNCQQHKLVSTNSATC